MKVQNKYFCFTLILSFLSLFFISNYIYAKSNSLCIAKREKINYKRNGYNLYFVKITSANCPSSIKLKYPDILLIHGVTYSSHQFNLQFKDYSVADFLVKNGFRVWLLDITGYGNSDRPQNGFEVNGDYAAQDIIGAVNIIRRDQRVEKVNLLGWSFGTISTSRAVKAYPNLINSLILYAPIYHGMGLPIPNNDSYQKFTDKAALSDFQHDNQTKQIISSIAEPQVIQQYLTQCHKYDIKGSANGCRKDLFQAKNISLFDPKALTMPVLIIGGTNDPYIDWKNDIPYIIKEMPNQNNRIVKIEGASHILMLEKPFYKLFQKSIINFLKENTSTD